MLNSPIENDWKNDAIKKIDRCIFKTISASEKEKAKLKAKKEKLINKILKSKAKEKGKNKENKKLVLKQKKQTQYKLKKDCFSGLKAFKDREPFLFEFVSASTDYILLKRKKLRELPEENSEEAKSAPSVEIPISPLQEPKLKIVNKSAKAKEASKLSKTNKTNIHTADNILDFDLILNEVINEDSSNPKSIIADEKPKEALSNLCSSGCAAENLINNKIKIDTKLFIKGNLINKIRKKDQRILKPKKTLHKKEFEHLSSNKEEKTAQAADKKPMLIKIPNSLQKGFKQNSLVKEKNLKAEIIKLKKSSNQKQQEQKKLNENSSNEVVKKIVKICKGKLKKFKKRVQRRDSNLYDINNFVVQNNTNKINERKDVFDIPIPVFKELADDFYLNNNYAINNNSNYLDNDYFFDGETIEDTSDEVYLKFHNVYEKREFDFRINYFKKKNQKQKCESNTPQENTSVQESNTIDSVIRINCNFLQEEGFLVK